ncbi:hypothetical protein GTY47_39585 [Streptomyces sp. SID5464]|nr:hypothetical protein [Streptomyces sp. SID5464]
MSGRWQQLLLEVDRRTEDAHDLVAKLRRYWGWGRPLAQALPDCCCLVRAGVRVTPLMRALPAPRTPRSGSLAYHSRLRGFYIEAEVNQSRAAAALPLARAKYAGPSTASASPSTLSHSRSRRHQVFHHMVKEAEAVSPPLARALCDP